ncbi:helicase-related protein [Paenibacillus dakarensis]|uniref:helicase-related protein n=1 Tax=Paenibacillus dakarensis TaxID=1527293 RepID=UPI0006D57CAC|nr:helicase-related protein [Paenibacillus dakarensis]
MAITLEGSLKNREKIIQSVKDEIIGPATIDERYKEFNAVGTTVFSSSEEMYKPYYWVVGNDKEEILQKETPTQRYVSAQLFPVYIKDEPLVLDSQAAVIEEADLADNLAVQNLFTTAEDIESTENEGEADLFPQGNDFKPSALGLTFSIGTDTPSLNVQILGGIYIPHTVRVESDSRGYEWWLREGVLGEVTLNVEELSRKKENTFWLDMKNGAGMPISYLKIQLKVRLRRISDVFVITVSVTNRSETGSIRRDQLILFQSELNITLPEEHIFTKYPKTYQMKETMNEDETSTELLYRQEGVYAFGHGCAAEWDQETEYVQRIYTTFMPQYETISMTPDIRTEDGPLLIKMSDMAGLSTKKHPKEILQPLIDGYRDWIAGKEDSIPELPNQLQAVAKKHMDHCKDSLLRIERGHQLLADDQILKAFRLANLAMLLQQENGKNKRSGWIDNNGLHFDNALNEIVRNEQNLKNASNTWRAFQIAFILMSIEGMVDESHMDREVVDLIWFPTGGGKTEAYLGVAAFQIILRRLRNPKDVGVDVMMRYTLRLLTADQFQRSSRLICSLEYIRKTKEPDLGEPFSIGIWVGSKTTPNKNTEANAQLLLLQKNDQHAQGFIVNNCPWCGAALGHYTVKGGGQQYFGYRMVDGRLVVHCPDKSCLFHDELPIYIVDETIYEKRPTFIIGTVDKFVQLVWEPRARNLFGINFDGERFVSPPSLIIQDELHLISGPLGTLAGLFEVLVEELCLKIVNGQSIKPKIIAATATIKQYEDQALALFGRKTARLFPSPGLEYDDSFFSKPARDQKTGKLMPGRKYVGVYTTTVRIMMAQVMTFSAISQAVLEIEPDERDPYWTLLAFYNTLRELGGGLTLAQTDIPQYSRALKNRRNEADKTRYTSHWIELTSRKQSHEISKTIDELKTPYNPVDNKKAQAIDLCLASNIIEVGVDIDRLSVMAIVGQPKMTAQYIQVSGRVGRRWTERPGVVFTLYSNTKSRDKSHFEHFREYHQRLYAQVEPTSVTPFSDSCMDRGLPAIVVGYLRQALNRQISRVPDWKEIEPILGTNIIPFYNRLHERAMLVDPEQAEEMKKRFMAVLKDIEHGGWTSWKVDAQVSGFMYPAGTHIPLAIRQGAKQMINSMRNVDAECRGYITAVYQQTESQTKSSWEDLFE